MPILFPAVFTVGWLFAWTIGFAMMAAQPGDLITGLVGLPLGWAFVGIMLHKMRTSFLSGTHQVVKQIVEEYRARSANQP